MSKSAQGLSLNVIIIGAIVLVVLLVIVLTFSSFFGNRFTPQFAAATEQECKNIKNECDDLTEQEIFGNFGKNFQLGDSCCKKIAASCEEDDFECKDSCKKEEGKEPITKNSVGLEYVCEKRAESCCKPIKQT